jgi:hypothetical protein
MTQKYDEGEATVIAWTLVASQFAGLLILKFAFLFLIALFQG